MAIDVGDAVLLRSIYEGHVRWCFPHHYAGTWDDRLGLYCRPGNEGKAMTRGGEAHYLEYWAGGGPPFDHVWDSTHVLRLMAPGGEHTVEVYWDLDWSLRGW